MKELFGKVKKSFKWTALSNMIRGSFGFLTIVFFTYFLGPEKAKEIVELAEERGVKFSEKEKQSFYSLFNIGEEKK